MSVVVRAQSRLFSVISRNCNRRFSSVTAEPPKQSSNSSSNILNDQPHPPSSTVSSECPRESIISSSTVLNDQPPPPPTTSPPPPSVGSEKKSWSFLKYGLIAAVTGGVATAGYATYAYTLEEVDEKTKALRASANYTVANDASSIDKFQGLLLSTAMTVPTKLVQLYLDLRKLTEEQVRGFTEPTSDKLLPDLHPLEQHVFTLVLDLNETLIYSDWTRDRGWRTFKRPGVDAFLEHMAQFYEVVVYSDQLNMYVDPVVERLDQKQCIRYKLSRGATRYVDGKHYRDLSMLNRDPSRVLYISGHAFDSTLQPENSVPLKPWKGEPEDTALLDLIPFLEYIAKARPADIRPVLASYQGHDIAKEFIERNKEHQRRLQEQKQQGRLWRR